jgi:hypothetical protein
VVLDTSRGMGPTPISQGEGPLLQGNSNTGTYQEARATRAEPPMHPALRLPQGPTFHRGSPVLMGTPPGVPLLDPILRPQDPTACRDIPVHMVGIIPPEDPPLTWDLLPGYPASIQEVMALMGPPASTMAYKVERLRKVWYLGGWWAQIRLRGRKESFGE